MHAFAPTRVRLSSVGKSYDGACVLSGLDFEAAAGDFVGIIGPSGCGKTTLLRLVAGLTEPSEGEVLVGDRPPAEANGGLAYVFQEPTLLPWLTVEENIRLLLELQDAAPDYIGERCKSVMQQVRLSGLEKRYPRQLSGGQKMRVSLARALSTSPDLLLLDEPFGSLDEMSREHLNEELLALRAESPWTAFFVTHSVSEAVFLSNRILVMGNRPGRIHREIDVPLPHPRTDEVRLSQEYMSLVANVSRVLRSVEEATP